MKNGVSLAPSLTLPLTGGGDRIPLPNRRGDRTLFPNGGGDPTPPPNGRGDRTLRPNAVRDPTPPPLRGRPAMREARAGRGVGPRMCDRLPPRSVFQLGPL